MEKKENVQKRKINGPFSFIITSPQQNFHTNLLETDNDYDDDRDKTINHFPPFHLKYELTLVAGDETFWAKSEGERERYEGNCNNVCI